MNNIVSKYVQLFDKRVFIDIASNGCGSGCVYCFTENPNHTQSLLDISVVNDICNKITDLPYCNEYIISLCPNTDPMKSVESRQLVLSIIDKLVSKVKFVQISTKEFIPETYLESLNSYAVQKGQIRISVSLPYLDAAVILEPGAASIQDRIKNFDNIKKYNNLVSILYLRPFNRQMLIDRRNYATIIKLHNPDNICLGAEFVPKVKGEQLCTYMYDEQIRSKIFGKADKEEIFEFADFLRKETGCKVFYSSICNIANCSNYGCRLKLKEYDVRYCIDCEL